MTSTYREDPERSETGEVRVRRTLADAERQRHQVRRFSMIAASIATVVVLGWAAVAIAQGTLGKPGESPVEPTPAEAPAAKAATAPRAATSGQRFRIAIGDAGYEPSTVTARSGSPIVLVVDKGEGCAAGFLMPSLGVTADNSTGPATVSLGTLQPGRYRFTCGMEMVEGTLIVD